MKKGELRELYQMMFPEYPDIVTVKDLREMLGISRKLAYKLIDYGYIHAVKIGTTLKIPKISVINYVIRVEQNASFAKSSHQYIDFKQAGWHYLLYSLMNKLKFYSSLYFVLQPIAKQPRDVMRRLPRLPDHDLLILPHSVICRKCSQPPPPCGSYHRPAPPRRSAPLQSHRHPWHIR